MLLKIVLVLLVSSLSIAKKPQHTYGQDHDTFARDIGVKLKKEYADDLVSDLFATTYGLEKVARMADLNNDDTIFHFKLPRRGQYDDGSDYEIDNDEKLIDYAEELLGSHRRRFKRHVESKIEMLQRDDRVEHVYPQVHLSRHKRRLDEEALDDWLDKIDESVLKSLANKYLKKPLDLSEGKKGKAGHGQAAVSNLPNEINFNDAEYRKEWYLINDGQLSTPPMHDMNVRNAWLNGYTGKNVSIVIVDDGLDYEHPDFLGKYRADLSYDFNDENDTEHDPMPRTFDDQNNHGTRCAGAAVAAANNSVCGVGIAYDAQIAGIRILDGPITDLLEARALAYKASKVHIRSASWGPRDDGAHMEYPGPFVNMALESGVKHGRNGKGTLYVWASGNGGGNDDDCSADGYVSHWDIISIGSVNHRGVTPYFMELCPSTMAVVYSGGQVTQGGEGESDSDDPGVRVVASDVRGKCTTTFQGTSSAAPLAAGALALVLEANPDLSYRDVMHLIARTARIPNIEDKEGWVVNGAGYHVNDKYGFGVMDVSQMLQEAQTWQNVGDRQKCVVDFEQDLPEIKQGELIDIHLDVKGCDNIDKLEHTIANISFQYERRGNLKLTLISPHGTPSELLSYRRNDLSDKAVHFFPFMTLFKWGESPRGEWTLRVETRPGTESHPRVAGQLQSFSLVFYGSRKITEPQLDDSASENKTSTETSSSTEQPDKSTIKSNKRFVSEPGKRAFFPSHADVSRIYTYEMKRSREAKIVSKPVIDENPDLRDILKNIDLSEAEDSDSSRVNKT